MKAGAKQGLQVGAGLLLLLLASSWVYFTFLESEEAKVRRVMATMVEAAGDNNPRGILDQMHRDFIVHFRRHRVDKQEVHKTLLRLLLANYKYGFEVTLEPAEPAVQIADDKSTATAECKVFCRGRLAPDGPWVNLGQREAQGKLLYMLRFEKTDDGWRLRELTFRPLTQGTPTKKP